MTASVVAGVLVLCAAPATMLSAQTRVDFQRDVRPLLSDNCFLCHGPDASTRKANLRLDLHEDALAPRRNGAPIVPGKPEQSLLYKKITEADPARRMPPLSSHKSLSDGADRDAQTLDRAGRGVETALGVHRARAPRSARGRRSQMEPQPDRSVRAGEDRGRRPGAESRGGPARAHSTRVARPDGVAAASRGRGGIRRGYSTGCVRQGREPVAVVAALRRAPRALLARCGSVRRHERPSLRQLPRRHLAVSRLGREGVQRATCRSIDLPSSSWPAICCPTRRSISSSPPGSSATTPPPMKTASSKRRSAFSTRRTARTRPARCFSD